MNFGAQIARVSTFKGVAKVFLMYPRGVVKTKLFQEKFGNYNFTSKGVKCQTFSRTKL